MTAISRLDAVSGMRVSAGISRDDALSGGADNCAWI